MQRGIVQAGNGMLWGIAMQWKVGMGLDTGLLEDIQVLELEDNLTLELHILGPEMGNT